MHRRFLVVSNIVVVIFLVFMLFGDISNGRYGWVPIDLAGIALGTSFLIWGRKHV
ncbi:MAG: hypothetical protein HYT62_01135 [Candidatus Yanofskybacteria bacterium]|nr:hypothetical protein [Candidatus Yanofskybacteria bacterium]